MGFLGKLFGKKEEEKAAAAPSISVVAAAKDAGATPVEMVLSGLAGCLTAGVASVAQNRGIQLNSVTATLEGDMDLQGILGIDSDVRNGFDGIRVKYNIDADASEEDIKALVAQSQKRSDTPLVTSLS